MESITKYFKKERDPLFRKGKAKGIAEGKAEEAKAIAIEMKKDTMTISQIVKFTKLSETDIDKLVQGQIPYLLKNQAIAGQLSTTMTLANSLAVSD